MEKKRAPHKGVKKKCSRIQNFQPSELKGSGGYFVFFANKRGGQGKYLSTLSLIHK